MNKIKLFTFVLIALIINGLSAQTDQIIIRKEFNNLPWNQFVNKLENQYPIRIFYNPEELSSLKLEVISDVPLLTFLNNLLSPYAFSIIKTPDGNLLISKQNDIKTLPPDFIQKPSFSVNKDDLSEQKTTAINNQFIETQEEYLNKELIIGNKLAGFTQKKALFTGKVVNIESKLPIEGATLYFKELENGVATDINGHFSFSLNPGNYTLTVKSVATKESKYALQIYSDGEATIYLEDQSYMLNEVIVSSEEIDNIRSTQMGVEKISTQSVKEIPLILGEQDILKVAEMLPGVQSAGEGTAGFNVRGSPTDQNLFIINNVHVYNPTHLGGFFSAFNSDAIQNFTLYKSNIPAKFGGRLSSIFDISAREGDMKSFKASGGISPITGRVLLEGPISKDKSSYLISVRSTYSDWMLKLVDNIEIKNSNAQFGDIFTNFTFRLNEKNKINLFSYYSNDYLNFYKRTNYRYQNLGSSLKWDHAIKNTDILTTILSYSKYTFQEENIELGIQAYQQSNEMEHFEFKSNLKWTLFQNHLFDAGISAILYQLDNGKFLPIEESVVKPKILGTEKGLESALFISDEWKINEKLTLLGGLRFSSYLYLGPQTINNYQPGKPLLPTYQTGTTEFGNNEIIKSYQHLDFRLAANYLINDQLSLKLSYNQLHQYLFMFSNTIAVSPNDKWKLSDNHIKPLSGDQFSVGVYTKLFDGKLESSFETYYKSVHDLVELRDGADLLINEHPEQSALQGELDAYGFEFSFKKPKGKLNGWINYTYSNASVIVDDVQPENRINFGQSYPSNYNKPHALNIVANLQLARRFSLSGNFVYSTGRPITYPASIYYLDGIEILQYTKRNEYRIPDYIRFDFSVKMEGTLKQKKLAHGSWSFSVYNLFGRENAYSVYFKNEDGKIEGYKLSIFGSPIVSLSYNFKLGNYAN